MGRKIGVVLSGGGAKGAYEVGVWHALEVMGADAAIDGIIGASVGALNAVLLDCGRYKNARAAWENMRRRDFFCIGFDKQYRHTAASDNSELQSLWEDFIQSACEEEDDYIKKDEKEIRRKFQIGLLKRNLQWAVPAGIPLQIIKQLVKNGVFSQRKIKQLIEKHVDFQNRRRKVYVVCKNSKQQNETVCFDLDQYGYKNKRRILLASSALPFVFHGIEGIQINGTGYIDAGGDKQKNTPIGDLYQKGWRKMIVVWLNNEAPLFDTSPSAFPGSQLIHIVPSEPLGNIFTGTMNFDSKKITHLMQLGFDDTMKKKSEILYWKRYIMRGRKSS